MSVWKGSLLSLITWICNVAFDFFAFITNMPTYPTRLPLEDKKYNRYSLYICIKFSQCRACEHAVCARHVCMCSYLLSISHLQTCTNRKNTQMTKVLKASKSLPVINTWLRRDFCCQGCLKCVKRLKVNRLLLGLTVYVALCVGLFTSYWLFGYHGNKNTTEETTIARLNV